MINEQKKKEIKNQVSYLESKLRNVFTAIAKDIKDKEDYYKNKQTIDKIKDETFFKFVDVECIINILNMRLIFKGFFKYVIIFNLDI